jgi:GAF domain-containing protein
MSAPPARVLWVAAPGRRPAGVRSATLLEAETQAAAIETLDSLEASEQRPDAVVTAPVLPDGDGGTVLGVVRDRWPDAACFLHGDLQAVPEGASLPVCEFHPASRTPSAVADSVRGAIRERYHRPYPVFEEEGRRLAVLDAVDFEAARPDLRALASAAETETDADLALVSVVGDYTVRFAAASDDTSREELPRGESVCTYAIREREPTTVPDVSSDRRLADVDSVCRRAVRSYAAYPLWVDGVPLGALVALDEEPGAFTASRRDPLARHAERAERALEATL